MKAVIVTTQQIQNYGAVLQAYALHRFLEVHGYEHTFLDQHIDNQRLYEQLLPLGKNTIAALYYNTLTFFHKKPIKKRFELFRAFRQKYIPESTLENIIDCDIYISGGDQLFNRSCLRQPVNLLQFGSPIATRISYSTSMGSADFSEEELYGITNALNRYAQVSLREKDSKQLLDKYLETQTRTDLDCSLLIDAGEWEKISALPRTTLPDKYILVYELMHHGDIDKVVEKVKGKMNLPVVAILTKPRKSVKADFLLYDVGPQEFVGLFQKASYIVTTSFHGTCFSIIFRKPFVVLVQPYEKRITAMLQLFGLSNNYHKVFNGSLNLDVPNYRLTQQEITVGQCRAEEYFEYYFRRSK